MRHQRSTFISLAFGCFVLFSGLVSDSNAQTRVIPFPIFDTPAKITKAEAYRSALGQMSSHLCREPNTPRASVDWNARFTELETKLIVAEHAVIWSAAGGTTEGQLDLIADFHEVRLRMVALMDRLIPRYEGLRVPTVTIRDSENKFAIAARKARLDNPIAAVHALRLMLYEFDRPARNILQQTREYSEYRGLMKQALGILGQIQFQKYDHGRDETVEAVPAAATFPFAVHAPLKGSELRAAMAITKELLGSETIAGIDPVALLAFDLEFPWQRVAPFSIAELSGPIALELKGQCEKEVVEVVYARSLAVRAERVEDLLVSNKFEVKKRIADARETAGLSEFHKRIYYQKGGTASGAQFMTTLLRDVDKFRPVRADVSLSENARSDYTIWLLELPPPKKQMVDVVYTNERSEDATIAEEILANNGYKVNRKSIEDYRTVYPNKLVFRSGQGANPGEARDIARLVRSYEAVEPLDMEPVRMLVILPPYELWMITKKEEVIDLNGTWLGYNYECPGDKSVQEIRMEQTGDKFIGTKISGNKCVTDGEVTVRGRITGNVMTGEQNRQIGGGTQREFLKVTFKIENKDLIIVERTMPLRRQID